MGNSCVSALHQRDNQEVPLWLQIVTVHTVSYCTEKCPLSTSSNAGGYSSIFWLYSKGVLSQYLVSYYCHLSASLFHWLTNNFVFLVPMFMSRLWVFIHMIQKYSYGSLQSVWKQFACDWNGGSDKVVPTVRRIKSSWPWEAVGEQNDCLHTSETKWSYQQGLFIKKHTASTVTEAKLYLEGG